MSKFERKYDMTREENVMWAKRMVVDSIWKEANLEGIGVTFPETQEIYDGRTVAGLTITQTKAINNLKHAWEFVLENLGVEIDMRYLRQLNGIIGAEGVVGRAGELRSTEVRIAGIDWRPKLPELETIKQILADIEKIENPIDRALELFCAISRGQWFYDGNKRTAQLAANAVLIDSGNGVLAISQEKRDVFFAALVAFYESGFSGNLKAHLYEHALDGSVPLQKNLNARIKNALEKI